MGSAIRGSGGGAVGRNAECGRSAAAAASLHCYSLYLLCLVAAYTPTVRRGYCVAEHHFVLNHCG